MACGEKRIDAGNLTFGVRYRVTSGDQGVTIRAFSSSDADEKELVSFDCFDQTPHYHYGGEGRGQRVVMDKTTAGNPIGWTLKQLRTRLPQMLERAGHSEIAETIDQDAVSSALVEVEKEARSMAVTHRSVTVHNRGEPVFEAGNVRFGLEYRNLSVGQGMAIHVLSDVAGQEIELLAFDCFDENAHYHYGPRNQNVVLQWDRTVVPDPLQWTLDQFKGGNLGGMLQRAGYPSIVAEMDNDLVRRVVAEEVEPAALAMQAANSA